MTQASLERRSDHEEAVTPVEEMAACLGLTVDYVRDVTERSTGQPWDNLDTEGAEAVADLPAEALDHTFHGTRPLHRSGDAAGGGLCR